MNAKTNEPLLGWLAKVYGRSAVTNYKPRVQGRATSVKTSPSRIFRDRDHQWLSSLYCRIKGKVH